MDTMWAAFLVLLLFLCAAPLALAVVALGWLKQMRGEMVALRKKVAVLEVNQKSAALAWRRAASAARVGQASLGTKMVMPPPVMRAGQPVSVGTSGGKWAPPVEPSRQQADLPTDEEPQLELDKDVPPDTGSWAGERDTPSDEELATPFEAGVIRAAVWVGGVAFALAGIFLVAVAMGGSLGGPPLRVVAGALFGLLLVALGIWRHRREAGIGQALSAAGVAVLFASILGAVNLYGMVSPLAGFGLLAAVTGLAVTLSLRQGNFVAMLGLVGGFVTPALIHADHPSPPALFGYLLLLQAGLLLVALVRRCPWLAMLTVLAAEAWAAVWLTRDLPGFLVEERSLGVYVLLSALLTIVAVLRERGWSENRVWPRVVGYFGATIGLGLAAGVAARSGFAPDSFVWLGLLAAACVVLGRVRAVYEPLAGFGLLLALAMVLAAPHSPQLTLIAGVYGACSAGLTLLLLPLRAGGAWRWALASVVLAIAYTVCVLGRLPWEAAWALLPAGVGVFYVGASLLMREGQGRSPRERSEILMAGGLVLLVIAPALAFDGVALTLAWAALLLIAAAVNRIVALQAARIACALLAGLVGVRLVLNPLVLDYATSLGAWWNSLFAAYLGSIAALTLASKLLRLRSASAGIRKEWEAGIEEMLEAVAVAVSLVFLGLLTHLAFHPGHLDERSAGVMERGVYGIVWLAAGFALLAMGTRWRRGMISSCGYLTIGVAALEVLIVQGLMFNPLWTNEPVAAGPAVTFGVPAVLLWAGMLWLRRRGREDDMARAFVTFLGAMWVCTLFEWVGMEVRQGFAGGLVGVTSAAPVGGMLAERATYGLAWMLLGLLLIRLGRGINLGALRGGGYLVIAAAVVSALVLTIFGGNPWLVGDDVGRGVLAGGLLYAYALPGLLTALAGVWMVRSAPVGARGLGEWIFGKWMQAVAIMFLFVLVTLEVRHAFQGQILSAPGRPGAGEMYAYSLAWGLLGTLLLVGGILVRNEILRWASLAVMLVTVLKVFLYDTGNPSDLLRVLSLGGLGVALTVLGLLYHHFVFRRDARSGSPSGVLGAHGAAQGTQTG